MVSISSATSGLSTPTRNVSPRYELLGNVLMLSKPSSVRFPTAARVSAGRTTSTRCVGRSCRLTKHLKPHPASAHPQELLRAHGRRLLIPPIALRRSVGCRNSIITRKDHTPHSQHSLRPLLRIVPLPASVPRNVASLPPVSSVLLPYCVVLVYARDSQIVSTQFDDDTTCSCAPRSQITVALGIIQNIAFGRTTVSL